MMVFLKSVGVKENRTTLLCKKSGGDAEICEVENQDAAQSRKRHFGAGQVKLRGKKEESAVERIHP